MNGTLTKIAIGMVTVISGGAYVPVIPSELEAGLSGMPAMRGYQYDAGSDRTDYRLENGELVNKGTLPDADFTDDDGNGKISVAVYTDRKGQDVYKKITDEEYRLMGIAGGGQNNPSKTEMLTLFEAYVPVANGAIAIDATSEGYANGTSITYEHTVTGSNPILMVQLYSFQGTQPSVTGITYNSVALTSKGSRVADGSGYTQQWSLVAPATGTNNIVVSMSTSQVFTTSASYTGVNQTTPHPDATLTGSVAGTSFAISTTDVTVDQSWIVMAGRSPSRVPTASAGAFLRKTNSASGDAGWTVDSNGGRSTGANTLDYTYSPSQTTYYVITNIAPVTTSVSTTTPTTVIQGDIQLQGDVIIQ